MKKIFLTFVLLSLVFIFRQVIYVHAEEFRGKSELAQASVELQAPATNSAGQGLAACKFRRSDLGTNADQEFKSQKLLGYFDEASKKSSIPATLLAAVARIESPSSVNLTDADLENYSCPVSPTGALGLMQIQPAGTTGNDPDAINSGANFLGKSATSLTREDYCNVRTSIFLSAGFILKKLQYRGVGDGAKWDPVWSSDKEVIDKVAKGYYGCLPYGGKSITSCDGPYSYGDDLWTSMQSCKDGRYYGSSLSTSASYKFSESNEVITRVGNAPLSEKPQPGSLSQGNVPINAAPAGGFTFYCQNDPNWASTCSLSAAGCGPTSLAMVMSSLGASCEGGQCIPPAVDSLMQKYGFRACGNAPSYMVNAIKSTWLTQAGFVSGPNLISGGSIDYGEAKKYIDQGYLIIGSTANAPSCNCDHIFVVQNVDPDSKSVSVRDPVCRNGQEVNYNYNNIRWSYAYPIRYAGQSQETQ